MNIDTIKQLAVSTIKDDATFQSLTGATALDPRLHKYYSGEPSLSDVLPGFATYSFEGGGETTGAVMSPVMILYIFAITPARAEQIRNRICALFDKQTLTTSDSLRVRGRRINERDVFQDRLNYHGRQLHIRLAALEN